MDLNPLQTSTTPTKRDATSPAAGAARDMALAWLAVRGAALAATYDPALAPIAEAAVQEYAPVILAATVGAITLGRKALQNWIARRAGATATQ